MNSVVIKSINREKIDRAVDAYTGDLRAKHPEIERIYWFGSWVDGLPSPGSDVDLCIIISNSEKIMRDRIPEYLPVKFPVGIDLFVYTRGEFEQLAVDHPGWYKVITSGKEIACRVGN